MSIFPPCLRRIQVCFGTVVVLLCTVFAFFHRGRNEQTLPCVSPHEGFSKPSEPNVFNQGWEPCMPNHPSLCRKEGIKSTGGYYEMRFQANALDDAAVSLVSSLSNKTIFHFGTGDHHVVGLANLERSETDRNWILAITASPGEYESYMKLLASHPALFRWYHVLYGNAFALHHILLPKFDFITLFHLGEYGKSISEEISLLRNLAKSLKPGGRVLLHPASAGFTKGKQILRSLAESGLRSPESKDILPFILSPKTIEDVEEYALPNISCVKDVVPIVFSHEKWGYIYQTYCREYDSCKGWYLPGREISLPGIGSLQSATKLMIVSHPDDELIFGGNFIGGNDGANLFIVYCTNDFQRIDMAKQVVKELGLAGGLMFSHGDSNLLETRADFRLYKELYNIISSKAWDVVVTHGAHGEYGHPFHKIVHRMVSNILSDIRYEAPSVLPKELHVFDLAGVDIISNNRDVRIKLLENVYHRPSSFWTQIHSAGTILIDLPTSSKNLHFDTICWP